MEFRDSSDGYDSDADPVFEMRESDGAYESDDSDLEAGPSTRSNKCQNASTKMLNNNIVQQPNTQNNQQDAMDLHRAENGEQIDEQKNVVQIFKPYARKLKTERKLKRNTGLEYVTAKGKIQRKREIKKVVPCRMKCNVWLNADLRKTIFDEYWQCGTHERRMSYISRCVTSQEIKCRRIRTPGSDKQRGVTYQYTFEIDGQRKQVCKKCFQGTLDESEKFIRNTLKNKAQSTTGVVKEDNRGKCIPKNKISPERIQQVITHINSFPKYESHYTRRVNSKLYLPVDLNLTKMYRLYRAATAEPVSRTIYNVEFHKLNLAFKKPKTDVCHKCEVLKMELTIAKDEENKNALKEQQTKHHEEADLAYTCKSKDKKLAMEEHSVLCYTFDLQQCLPTPFLETSVSFYKRKYWTYNLTIHNCGNGFASCYLWHESMAMRGANEIASCLFKELMNLPPEVKKVILYSDTCGGQNKNFYVATMFLTVLQMKRSLEQIDHKFLVSGHSHMECDADHSVIEKQKKTSGMQISHPHDWATLIRCANKKKPFQVQEMSQDDFYDFAALLKSVFVKRKQDSEKRKFLWHDCKWLRYTKEQGLIYYKKSLHETEEFSILNLNRRGRPVALSLSKKYTEPLAISKAKKDDLLELLPLIPDVYKSFYEQLVHSNAAADVDPDLEDLDPDAENPDLEEVLT